MTRSPALRSLDDEARAVEELLSQLSAATGDAIDALRCADVSALESALDARGSLLLLSGPAIEKLSLARSEIERSDPEATRVALEATSRLADGLRELDSTLNVALSAVHEQTRVELRTLDQFEAKTARYRPLGHAHGTSLDIKW